LIKLNKLILYYSVLIILLAQNNFLCAQGKNHQFLVGDANNIGTYTTATRSRLLFDSTSLTVVPDSFAMPFIQTQGNISDEQGNLLMVSNGIYIMNANGDTMLNGAGLNPGAAATTFATLGLPIPNGNVVLPMPGDSTKYVLLHHTEEFIPGYPSIKLYKTIVDMTLDGGLGGVVSKNVVVNQDSCDWGIATCLHANGRDWWVVIPKSKSDTLITFLLTPQGIYQTSRQGFGFPGINGGNVGTPLFSQDGLKFSISATHLVNNIYYHEVRLYDFDRCSGLFSNAKLDSIDNEPGLVATFSPNGKYLYALSFSNIYQYQTDTSDFSGSRKLVATYDGFLSLSQTDFWHSFLAANGKIYITSGGRVVDITCIEYPDSLDTACFVNQHSVHLPSWTKRGHVNHPNYYLGRLSGSPCDTLTWVGIDELQPHDFKMRISPNPNNGNFKLVYLLPQNEAGQLKIYDLTGRLAYKQYLPPWSSLQYISLPNLSSGIYSCIIESKNERVVQKVVVE
jgi:hypothetical protein